MTKILYPFSLTLIVHDSEFKRTVQLPRLSRKGSTIHGAAHKFKVIAEILDLDMHDTDQIGKNDKDPEGIIAIPRNLPENADPIKIQQALRNYFPEDKKLMWTESPISMENKRLIEAINKKKVITKNVSIIRPTVMDLVMFAIISIALFCSIVWLCLTGFWPVLLAIALFGLLFLRAFSKNSVFLSK